MKKKTGFTLIELLVVIAIIGILASIVLVSVTRARVAAQDAAIKASLAGVRVAAEMWFADEGHTYVGFCTSPDGLRIKAAVEAQAGVGAFACFVDANQFCVSSTLPGPGVAHCVDHTGAVGTAQCTIVGPCP